MFNVKTPKTELEKKHRLYLKVQNAMSRHGGVNPGLLYWQERLFVQDYEDKMARYTSWPKACGHLTITPACPL